MRGSAPSSSLTDPPARCRLAPAAACATHRHQRIITNTVHQAKTQINTVRTHMPTHGARLRREPLDCARLLDARLPSACVRVWTVVYGAERWRQQPTSASSCSATTSHETRAHEAKRGGGKLHMAAELTGSCP